MKENDIEKLLLQLFKLMAQFRTQELSSFQIELRDLAVDLETMNLKLSCFRFAKDENSEATKDSLLRVMKKVAQLQTGKAVKRRIQKLGEDNELDLEEKLLV